MSALVTLTLRRTEAGLALVLPPEWVQTLALSEGDQIAVAAEDVDVEAGSGAPAEDEDLAYAKDYMTRHARLFEVLAK